MIPLKIKPGVRINGLTPYMLLAIQAAHPIWEKHGARELVITSGTEGRHSKGSRHYSGLAIDLRVRDMSTPTREMCRDQLQAALGDDYDIVLETTHIHVEYDPGSF